MRRDTYDNFHTEPAARTTLTPVPPAHTGEDPADPPVRRPSWRGAYVRRLVAGDVSCALVAAVAASAVAAAPTAELLATGLTVAALAAGWASALFLAGSYDRDVLAERLGESGRVLAAAAGVLCGVALVAWGWRIEIPRGFVAVALPAAAALSIANRQLVRWWLRRAREQGRFLRTTLIVGPIPAVADLDERLRRRPQLGYRPIGCCPPTAIRRGGSVGGLPVLGSLDDVADVIRRHDVDTVAVLPAPELVGAPLRRLGWNLEESGAELLLAPAVTGIARPRRSTRPVPGLALLRVPSPDLRAVHRVLKWTFDRAVTALVLVLLAPLLLAVAVTLKLTTRGPVFARQERVGRAGRVFALLKFRTTEPDAERRLTRVGRVLRRYSLNELPQLVNVLKGDMSLVGPRPPLLTDVTRVDGDARPPVVRPGLTGLWQLNGRSDLSREESVDRDLQYVENWSLLLDVVILRRTLGAVLHRTPA